MKKMILLIALILIPALAIAGGVIIEAKGPVTIGTKKAKTGMEFKNGETVTTKTGGKATIMLSSGTIKTLMSGDKYTCKAEKKEADTSMTQGLRMAMGDMKKKSSGPVVHGMVKEAATGPLGPTQHILTKSDEDAMKSELKGIDALELTRPDSIAMMRAQVYYKYDQNQRAEDTLFPYCKLKKCTGAMMRLWKLCRR